jgi:thiamine biosynthesis lipoprotein
MPNSNSALATQALPLHSASFKRMIPLLGTFIRIELRSSVHDQEFLMLQMEQMFTAMKRVQAHMSFYENESDVSRLNRAPLGEWISVSGETKAVLRFAEELRKDSDGLFNVGFSESWLGPLYELCEGESCPQDGSCYARKIQKGEIDLGGVAKGFAVDQAVAVIRNAVEAQEIFGSINAGGDLYLFEEAPSSVAVQVPRGPVGGEFLFESLDHRILSLKNGAVATSSTRLSGEVRLSYRKRNEFDENEFFTTPKTATVIAASAMVADALTKVVLLSETAEELALAKKCLAKYEAQGLSQGLNEVHENV